MTEEPRAQDWKPKTAIGRKVFENQLLNIDEILDQGIQIMEPEITEKLLQLDSDLLLIGQAKGKFGGGKRRIFRSTQKKTQEGNKPKFSTLAVVGDHNGHIGIGYGKSKETVPAREKAVRKAKLNVFKIRRGCGSWQCNCGTPHSLPFAVEGKCGSVRITLKPAPKGKGLVVDKECAKVLGLAGVKDVWAKSRGQTRNKMNMIAALEDALKKLSATKIHETDKRALSIAEGAISLAVPEASEDPHE